MLLRQFREEQSCGNVVACFKRRRAGKGEGLAVKQNAGAAKSARDGRAFLLGPLQH